MTGKFHRIWWEPLQNKELALHNEYGIYSMTVSMLLAKTLLFNKCLYFAPNLSLTYPGECKKKKKLPWYQGAILEWPDICILPNSCVEILIFTIIVIEGGTLGKWLAHEGGNLMNGINDVTKGTTENFLTSSGMWGHNDKISNSKKSSHQNLIMLMP